MKIFPWIRWNSSNPSYHSLFRFQVTKLFARCRKETVEYVIEKYRLDFEMCGYKRTLEQLQNLLWHIVGTTKKQQIMISMSASRLIFNVCVLWLSSFLATIVVLSQWQAVSLITINEKVKEKNERNNCSRPKSHFNCFTLQLDPDLAHLQMHLIDSYFLVCKLFWKFIIEEQT